MGWNYERGEGEMLESYCHRIESVLSLTVGEGIWDQKRNGDNVWNRFTRVDVDFPGEAEVGSCHSAPNSKGGYDWENDTIVPTYADDWLTYPDLPREKKMQNCNTGGWRGIVNHHMWWMTHIPHNPGVTDGFYNNWWEYIVNYDEAIKTLQAGLEKKPDSFALRLVLGGVRESKGDYEAAISDYEALLKDSPDSLVVINNLASLLADHRTDDASLERALALAVNLQSSPVPQFKDTLGWLRYRRGEYKPAGDLLEAASNELPNLALVHYHLGMNYIALGQMQKASEELKKALELGAGGGVSEEQIQAALKKAS
jgi:tetratricopeptide (TPR) repeat protein